MSTLEICELLDLFHLQVFYKRSVDSVNTRSTKGGLEVDTEEAFLICGVNEFSCDEVFPIYQQLRESGQGGKAENGVVPGEAHSSDRAFAFLTL